MNQAIIARAIQKVMPAARATGLFVSLATFQSSDFSDFPDGFYSGNYQDVPGLVNLPCTAPPQSELRILAKEVKTTQLITDMAPLHVLLDKFYPTLDAGWRIGWRVVIDGTIFDLQGVEHDSQSQMSRVLVLEVTV